MFVEALPEGTRRNLALLADSSLVAPFYLAGGTAAALHMGHRVSVDLDFFSPAPFDSAQLADRLPDVGRFRLERLGEGTLLGELQDVRISFFRYRYPLIAEPVQVLGVTVAGLADIVAMKLDAISQRGTRRDFIDLYIIAQTGLSLSEALHHYRHKYAGLDLNLVHLIKSLTYLADAEGDPMPQMLVDLSWEEVKAFFQWEARALFESL